MKKQKQNQEIRSRKPEYSFYDTVLAANLIVKADAIYKFPTPQVLGRERTSYFYRKMAISFAASARRYARTGLEKIFPGIIETHRALAKSYFETFRRMKEAA